MPKIYKALGSIPTMTRKRVCDRQGGIERDREREKWGGGGRKEGRENEFISWQYFISVLGRLRQAVNSGPAKMIQ